MKTNASNASPALDRISIQRAISLRAVKFRHQNFAQIFHSRECVKIHGRFKTVCVESVYKIDSVSSNEQTDEIGAKNGRHRRLFAPSRHRRRRSRSLMAAKKSDAYARWPKNRSRQTGKSFKCAHGLGGGGGRLDTCMLYYGLYSLVNAASE